MFTFQCYRVYALQLQKAAELKEEVAKAKKKLANMNKTGGSNSVQVSLCNESGKIKSNKKAKLNKLSDEKTTKAEKTVKDDRSSRPRKSHRRDTVQGRSDRKRDKRSKERERKNRKHENNYIETREQNGRVSTGKTYYMILL